MKKTRKSTLIYAKSNKDPIHHRDKSVVINLIPNQDDGAASIPPIAAAVAATLMLPIADVSILPIADVSTDVSTDVSADAPILPKFVFRDNLQPDDATSDTVDVADLSDNESFQSDAGSAATSGPTTPTRKSSPSRRTTSKSGIANVNLIEQKFFDPRGIIRGQLMEICLTNIAFIMQTSQIRDALVRRIERSCYLKTFKSCELGFINKRWTDKIFVERYSSECYRIMTNLSMEGNDLISKIVAGEVSACDIANHTSQNLNPQSSAKERAALDLRINQRLDIKFSDKYLCAKCGERKTQYYEFQMRALDEASSIMLECVECKHKWIR